MSKHLRIYEINLAANGGQIEDIVGSSFTVISALGPFRVRSQDGLSLDAVPGFGIENFAFSRLEFVDTSGIANRVKIAAGGDPDNMDPKQMRFISISNAFLDAPANLALQNQSYINRGFKAADVANASYVGLSVDAGGPTLIVRAIAMKMSAAGNVALSRVGAATGTLYGGPQSLRGNNILSSVRTYTSLGGVAQFADAIAGWVQLSAGIQNLWVPPMPIIVLPNTELILYPDVINSSLETVFYFDYV